MVWGSVLGLRGGVALEEATYILMYTVWPVVWFRYARHIQGARVQVLNRVPSTAASWTARWRHV